jgi:CRISPR-associated protein Cas2
LVKKIGKKKMFYSICYDINDDRRRFHVARILKDFGERVQYSVFEANLRPEQLIQLITRMTLLLHPEEDDMRLYPLCAACASTIEILGQGTVTQHPEIIVI